MAQFASLGRDEKPKPSEADRFRHCLRQGAHCVRHGVRCSDASGISAINFVNKKPAPTSRAERVARMRATLLILVTGVDVSALFANIFAKNRKTKKMPGPGLEPKTSAIKALRSTS